jgi:hypothetical protein
MKSLYFGLSPHLVFKCGFGHVHRRVTVDRDHSTQDGPMSLFSSFEHHHDPDALSGWLHSADSVTPALMAEIVKRACRRFPSVGQSEKTARIQRLVQSAAWTDAALALIDLELPTWQVRRMAYDEGEWHCAISRARELPEWLDQSIEARHADLALAILSAFVEAQLISTQLARPSVPEAPGGRISLYQPLGTDNFS